MRPGPRQASPGLGDEGLFLVQFHPDGWGLRVRILRAERLRGSHDRHGRAEAIEEMRRPGGPLAPCGACSGHRRRRIVDVGEGVVGQRVVVRPEVGRRCERESETVLVGEPCLKPKTGMLAGDVSLALVIQSEIRDAQTLRSLDERVAELVQDHLGKAVVAVEGLRGPNDHDATPIGRGIHLGRALDAKADALGDRQPDGIEGVEIAVARSAFQCIIFAPMKAPRCPICKKELAKRTRNFPFCGARCKLVDAGNWFEGSYRVQAEDTEPSWGEN